MTVYEIDPLRDPRWNEFIERHPRSSVFHRQEWLRALQRTYGYEPFVVSTSAPARELENGLLCCRVKSWLTGRRFVSLPFSDHCDPLVTNDDELDCLLSHLKHFVDAQKWTYIEIRPTLAKPGKTTELEQSVAYYLHCVDLRKDIQKLFCSFHKNCVQRKIRRAETESLDYEEGCSEALLQKFYRLLVMTRKRQHLPPQPCQWFRHLMAELGQNLKIRVVSKDGVAVASIMTILHKQTMTYKYGCSDVRYNKLGGTALLFWNTIQEAKRVECVAFDLGRSALDNAGLIAFKEHWGASRSVINYWRYPHKPNRPASAWRIHLVNNVVSVAPDFSLVAAGKLLYPHIG
jgi:lipid II:glycine glycyltransferase (peptidoglycan interpeptide bridge formation enzyme)